jgi:hypothetical protein
MYLKLKSTEIIAENKLKQSVLLRIMQLKFQETEKDFNNAMGQESLTVLTNPKKRKPNKTKPAAKTNRRLIIRL